jgi:predicted DNA-binding transcriptional regulator AlpA
MDSVYSQPGVSGSHPAMRSLLPPKEAAKFLAIGSRKLWELTNCGEVPRLRIGRSLRYVPADLELWGEQQKARARRRPFGNSGRGAGGEAEQKCRLRHSGQGRGIG